MYLGDWSTGVTLHHTWDVRASGVMMNIVSGTVAIYKDGSLTEELDGVTLTANWDGRAGVHHLAIDFTADATFYAAGSECSAVFTAGTLDGISIVGMVACT